jgi:site-specific recombinase XerD
MERTTKYDDHLHREQVQGGLAPQTIHGFVRSLCAFASWLEREGYTQDNIFKAIKPPSSPSFDAASVRR